MNIIIKKKNNQNKFTKIRIYQSFPTGNDPSCSRLKRVATRGSCGSKGTAAHAPSVRLLRTTEERVRSPKTSSPASTMNATNLHIKCQGLGRSVVWRTDEICSSVYKTTKK